MSMFLGAAVFGIIVVLTSSLPAPLPTDCVPDVCPSVDSDAWKLLQFTCCRDNDIYHCQAGRNAHLQVVCAEVRHCDASQAVVVTSVGVDCRKCVNGTSQQVPGPSHYHNNLTRECGVERQYLEHAFKHTTGRTGNQPPKGRGSPQTDTPHRKHADDIAPYSSNVSYPKATLFRANQMSDTMKITNEKPDSSNSQDDSQPVWHVGLIILAMAAVTLIILGFMVFFVVRYFANQTHSANTPAMRLSGDVRYKHI